MRQHYRRIAERMLLDLDDSKYGGHKGEEGRSNEEILGDFLNKYLPRRYTVSTGMVIAATGETSSQIDLIIHDRLHTPQILLDRAFTLVPVESTFGVISVKTSLDKSQLRDAMTGIQSVRELPRIAASIQPPNQQIVTIPERKVLRPRAIVFAFRSSWTSLESAERAFVDLLDEFDDAVRPNAVCVLDKGFIHRRPFTTETQLFPDYPLLHFFMFLARTLDTFPKWQVDLSKYFEEYDENQSVPLDSSPEPRLD